MGYECYRFQSTIGRDLRCSICNLVCDLDFILETRCNHLFCRTCFEPLFQLYRQCPVTGNILKLGHLKKGALWAIALWNLKSLKISCDFKSNGCGKVVTLGKLARHVESCRYRLMIRHSNEYQRNSTPNGPASPSSPQPGAQNSYGGRRQPRPQSGSRLSRSQSISFHLFLEQSSNSNQSSPREPVRTAPPPPLPPPRPNSISVPATSGVARHDSSSSILPLINFDDVNDSNDEEDRDDFIERYEKNSSVHQMSQNVSMGGLPEGVKNLTNSVKSLKQIILHDQGREMDSLRSMDHRVQRLKESLENSFHRLSLLVEETKSLKTSSKR